MARKIIGKASRLDKVNFDQFVNLLEINKMSDSEKMQFLFELYSTNTNKSGEPLVDANDVFQILKGIVGS